MCKFQVRHRCYVCYVGSLGKIYVTQGALFAHRCCGFYICLAFLPLIDQHSSRKVQHDRAYIPGHAAAAVVSTSLQYSSTQTLYCPIGVHCSRQDSRMRRARTTR